MYDEGHSRFGVLVQQWDVAQMTPNLRPAAVRFRYMPCAIEV